VTIPFQPHDFFDAALLLTVRIDTDHNGQEASGTGFLLELRDGDKMAIGLISNRHVFRDGNGEIDLRFHAATDEKGRYDLGDTVRLKGATFAKNYVPHPTPDVDLGAAIVNAIGQVGKGTMLAREHVATAEELDGMKVGDPIWFVGYPDGWRDELHNLPLMRRGSLASLPRLSFDGRPEFVIDAQAFPGSSGSPVFGQIGAEMRLIGILAETRVHKSPVQGPPTVLGQFVVDEVVGLGIAIRGTEIQPLADAVRARAREVIAAQRADSNSI
jgi:Trypsin-like peptidase domain